MILFGSVAGRDRHVNWPGHPESPERLGAVQRALGQADLGDLLVPLEGRPATVEELARAHSAAYIESLAAFARFGGGEIDPDTAMSPGSWDTAVSAAGLGLAAVEALESGTADAAFLAVRPPGHHATEDRAQGFCLLNNVAVTAAALAERGQRVVIVDWDVHHGNGTQEIFWDDPLVLYASTHQWPAYPGTGRASEIGGPSARGLTINVPLPAGSTGDAGLLALETMVIPAVEAFGPDWLLISAGYDAHRADPMAELAWSAGDFGLLTRGVMGLVSRPGRTIAFLEGGYDLSALAQSVRATVAVLGGAALATEAPTAGGPGREAVAVAARLRHRVLGEAGL